MTTWIGELRDKKKIYCNKCGRETNHLLQASNNVDYTEEHEGQLYLVEQVFSRFFICAGCETACIEECNTGPNWETQDLRTIYECRIIPERTERAVSGKHFKQLPEALDRIYREVIRAFNAGLYVLTAVGLRTLIEGICADKSVSGANLQPKINNLTNLLPPNIVDSLHSFRFMGNKAAHELKASDKHDLRLAIEVSEDLLNFLYELDYKARSLPR